MLIINFIIIIIIIIIIIDISVLTMWLLTQNVDCY